MNKHYVNVMVDKKRAPQCLVWSIQVEITNITCNLIHHLPKIVSQICSIHVILITSCVMRPGYRCTITHVHNIMVIMGSKR